MNRTLLASIVFVGASLVGSAALAQATVGNTPQSITLTDGAGYFGDTFAANNTGSVFADRFNFSVSNGGSGGAGGMNSLDAIVSSISRSADTGLAITGLTLYGANGAVVTQGSSLQSGAIDVWTIRGNNLTAGNYYLQVAGNLVGNAAAAFGGAISMAAPVPEPESYSMLLAGLGVLGVLGRRRKAGDQASSGH